MRLSVVLIFLTLVVSQPASKSIIPIYTESELQDMRKCADCLYVLLANLTLANLWTPIGDSDKPFIGLLDGRGFSITFRGFSVTKANYIGLFGYMDSAKVINLKLISLDATIIVPATSTKSIGMLAGHATNSTVYGCSVVLAADVRTPRSVVIMGGLIGTLANSTVVTSFVNISINISDTNAIYLGGFVGNSVRSKYEKCEAHVAHNVEKGNAIFLGGVIAASQGSAIGNCLASGVVMSRAKSITEFIGGLIGFTTSIQGGSMVQSVMVDVKILSGAALGAEVGGIVGHADGTLSILRCDTLLWIDGFTDDLSAGGLVGNATKDMLYINLCRVKTSINLSKTEATLSTAYVGGLVGITTAVKNTISHVTVYTNITVLDETSIVGGVVGFGEKLQLVDCVVLGMMTAKSLGQGHVSVGGIVGRTTDSSITRCLFAGTIVADVAREIVAGALGATIAGTSLFLSYALANMSCSADAVSTGTIALASASRLDSCYSVVRINISAANQITAGGLVASFRDDSHANSSFVLVSIFLEAQSSEASAGGLVGVADASALAVTIADCYAWGVIGLSLVGGSKVFIGGLGGLLRNAVAIFNCLVYLNISSRSEDVVVGALAGRVLRKDAADVLPLEGINRTVVYVAPGGNLTDVKLIGGEMVTMAPTVYCAEYPNTTGCTALDTLNSQEFLKASDLTAIFQLNASLANGNLVLKGLPAPHSGAISARPRLVLANEGVSVQWSSRAWRSNEAQLDGYPFLRDVDYTTFCRPALSCHGFGTSPVSFVCFSGWSSPQRKSSDLVDDALPCSVHLCRSASECSMRGICIDGKCECDSGYSGLDCSVPICAELDGVLCQYDKCMPFSDTSQTGICVCRSTEYLTAQGLCMPGCQPLGAGICLGPDTVSCTAGYSPDNGCLSYDCSMVTENTCNGRGTCTDKRCVCSAGNFLLNGNCYTPCSPTITENCITVDCGDGNGCLGLGLCTAALSDRTASCTCNVDQAGWRTNKNHGGSMCSKCADGYAMYQGECVRNACLRCVGGTCAYSPETSSYRCKCPKGLILIRGMCSIDRCDTCPNGECIPIPNGQSASESYCLCRTGLPGKECYGYDCGACDKGVCQPNDKTMTVMCACPVDYVMDEAAGACTRVNMAQNSVVIMLPIVLVGIAVGVTAAASFVLLRRRQSKRVRMGNPSEMLGRSSAAIKDSPNVR